MGIKLKNNKYVVGCILIILVYLLSFSVLLVSDVYKNRKFLNSQPYFSSDKFKADIDIFSRNLMNLYVNYKDFDKRSDNEKVIDSEVSNELSLNEQYITNKQKESTDKYYNLIRDAQARNDFDNVKKLNEELIKQISDTRNKNSKTADEVRNEMINWKTKDYENIKNSLMQNGYIKYYIKNNNTNEVYTNMDSSFSIKDVNNYIKENALYSIHFPDALSKNNFYSWTNNFFNNSSIDGYMIIPKDIKNSYIYKDYEYYNSIRTRIIEELVILLLVISIIVLLCIYLIYNKRILYNII
ncbi:MAG: hypothetical protein ABF633_02415, partial [Clostridium sp.]